MTTRRQFIGATAALLGAGPAGASAAIEPARRKLDILFLGGTGFIGPHQVNYALARGHNVTTFNRGRKTGLYGDRVEELTGNRDSRVDGGLRSLAGKRRWDAVVDNSGYVPRHVRDSATLLEGRVGRYIFTSSVAVYDLDAGGTFDADSPLLPAPNPATEVVNGKTYGPLKAECDRIVRDVYGKRATVVRPFFIVGPGDTTDRFTYWVERFYRGGDIVCPSGPELEIQWVDARDLCSWIVTLAEKNVAGIFNASGPASPMTTRIMMHGLRAFCAKTVRLHWPTREQLDETGFRAPLFDVSDHSIHVDSSGAMAAGLRYRSLADTVRDTHDWWRAQPLDRRRHPRRWPDAASEARVLARL